MTEIGRNKGPKNTKNYCLLDTLTNTNDCNMCEHFKTVS